MVALGAIILLFWWFRSQIYVLIFVFIISFFQLIHLLDGWVISSVVIEQWNTTCTVIGQCRGLIPSLYIVCLFFIIVSVVLIVVTMFFIVQICRRREDAVVVGASENLF